MTKEKKLLVISSYPEKGLTHGKKTVGVASYSKNTLLALKKAKPDLKIVVLAEKFGKQEIYEEKGISIKRVWQRNNFFSVFKLLRQIFTNRFVPTLICFEGFMFGSFLFSGLFLTGLFLLRIIGVKPVLVLHQVVEDFNLIEKNKIKAFFLNKINFLFKELVLASSDKVIVFEQYFKKILGNSKKAIFIPHAVEEIEMIKKEKAHKQFGFGSEKFHALYFGFLSPYKGVDLLVKNWPNTNDNKLILAGDGNPNHLKEKAYADFVKKIKSIAKKKGIITTGFVAEEKIAPLFCAADLVLLPYQVFFSSSGPLSLAFAYQKPFLLSESLKNYLASDDFKKALEKTNLSYQEILFDPNSKNDLENKIANVKKKKKQFENLSRFLKESRSWSKIAKDYLTVLSLNK